MSVPRAELSLLQVVQESEGEWDLRNIDYKFYGGTEVPAEFDIVESLKRLAVEGFLVDIDAHRWGAGWKLTTKGVSALTEAGLSATYVVIAYRNNAEEESLHIESSWLDGGDASARAQSLNDRSDSDLVYRALVARGMRSAVNAEPADK